MEEVYRPRLLTDREVPLFAAGALDDGTGFLPVAGLFGTVRLLVLLLLLVVADLRGAVAPRLVLSTSSTVAATKRNIGIKFLIGIVNPRSEN